MARHLFLASFLVLALPVGAAEKPRQQTPVPPPPTLEDPGIAAAASAAEPGKAAEPRKTTDAPPAGIDQPLPKPDTRPARDRNARNSANAAAVAERTAASNVAVRKEGTDTVEEYRQNGRVWMIRIVRPDGTDQTFMDMTGNGRLTRDPNEGPVAPVYFRLYEWN